MPDIQTGGDVVVDNQNANAYAPKIIEHLQHSLPFQFALSVLGYGNGFTTHHDYLEGRLDLGEGSDVATMGLERSDTLLRAIKEATSSSRRASSPHCCTFTRSSESGAAG